jgi:hypothetical protein
VPAWRPARRSANARTQGVESNVEWLATNSLTFTGSIGYAAQTAATGCINGVQDLFREATRSREIIAQVESHF